MIFTLVTLALAQQTEGLPYGEKAAPDYPKDQQIAQFLTKALEVNAASPTELAWKDSGYHPSDVFKNAKELEAPKALCKGLKALKTDEELAMFEGEILHRDNRRFLRSCRSHLIYRLKRHWIRNESLLSHKRPKSPVLKAHVERSKALKKRNRVRSKETLVTPTSLELGHQVLSHEMALTFVGGPHPVRTPKVLALLKKHKIRGTFLLNGKKAKRYPVLTARIAKEGHSIGASSWSGRPLGLLPLNKARDEMKLALDTVSMTSGQKTPLYTFHFTAKPKEPLLDEARKLGIHLLKPSHVDLMDWRIRNSRALLEKTLSMIEDKPQDRGVVLRMNDSLQQTLIVLPHLIEEVRARDMRMVVSLPHKRGLRKVALR